MLRIASLVAACVGCAACQSGLPPEIMRSAYVATADCADDLGLTRRQGGGHFYSPETTIDEAVAMHVDSFGIAAGDEAALRRCARRTHAERNATGT